LLTFVLRSSHFLNHTLDHRHLKIGIDSQKKALLTYLDLEEAAMEQAEHKGAYMDKIIPFSSKWLAHLKVAIS
jgi:hypothetical protein